MAGRFVPDVAGHAGSAAKLAGELRQVLRELKVDAREDPRKDLRGEFTPSASYEPIPLRFFFPGGQGILAVEGTLILLEGPPHEELRHALNFLCQEVAACRFYAGQEPDGRRAVFARADLLPNLDAAPALHARDLRQALTGLCAQRAIFAEPLQRVQGGQSWRFVRDTLKALK